MDGTVRTIESLRLDRCIRAIDLVLPLLRQQLVSLVESSKPGHLEVADCTLHNLRPNDQPLASELAKAIEACESALQKSSLGGEPSPEP